MVTMHCGDDEPDGNGDGMPDWLALVIVVALLATALWAAGR
jgi:hypothetical protein